MSFADTSASGPLAAALRQRLWGEVAAVVPELRDLRRVLHRFPEIGFEVGETRQRLLAALPPETRAHLTVLAPLLGHDLVLDLPGGPPGAPSLALRADLDALPIEEATGRPWASAYPGAMHACGHDGHSTMLLGAARVLARLRADLPGPVRFIFQPAEENLCGGKHLVAAGVLAGQARVYALHGWPGLPAGQIASRVGPLFAAAAFFEVAIEGIGGHAAMPELCRNPLLGLADLIQGLDRLHRQHQAADGSVVSSAVVQGGEASNIIPARAVLRGTVRSLSSGGAETVRNELQELLDEVAGRRQLRCHLVFDSSYEFPVVNDADAVAALRQVVTSARGPEHYHEAPRPSMAAEDFAFYLQKCPGAMFWLGLGPDWPGLHSPQFDFNDEVLADGILAHCLLALRPRDFAGSAP